MSAARCENLRRGKLDGKLSVFCPTHKASAVVGFPFSGCVDSMQELAKYKAQEDAKLAASIEAQGIARRNWSHKP